MSTTLQNSIWPNTDGNLGNIKAVIPSGIGEDKWPEGDALVSNFVYKDGKLVGLVDAKALTVNDTKSTTFPYDYVNIQVDKSLEGVMTFNKGERTKYLTITYTESGNSGDTIVLGTKYINCTTAEEVRMFDYGYHINDIKDGVWSESLANLTTARFQVIIGGGDGPGEALFEYCDNLIIFNSDLSSLTEGYLMFRNCSNLTTFNANLSKLGDGGYMFSGCVNLTNFNPENLDSIEYADMMLDGCKLNAASVKNLIGLLQKRLESYNGWGIEITIGMGCEPTESDMDAFAKECGYDNIEELQNKLYRYIRLDCDFQYNGRPSSSYSLRRPIEDRLPIYVKLSEIEENQNSYYNYTSLDGSKKYKLNWFHTSTGSSEGYTQFNSLEEAIETLNIKPIERN